MLNVPRCLLSAYKQNIGVDDNFYNLPKIRQTLTWTSRQNHIRTVLDAINALWRCDKYSALGRKFCWSMFWTRLGKHEIRVDVTLSNWTEGLKKDDETTGFATILWCGLQNFVWRFWNFLSNGWFVWRACACLQNAWSKHL